MFKKRRKKANSAENAAEQSAAQASASVSEAVASASVSEAAASACASETVTEACDPADIIECRNVTFAYEVAEEDEPEQDAKPEKDSKPRKNAKSGKTAKAAEEPEPELVKLVQALKGIDLRVKRGEFVAVIGRNGSGKSTLAKLMNALYLPATGTVVVDNIDTSEGGMEWEVRSRVGMVFQNPDNQIIGATVEEDVAFGLENLGVPRPEMLERIAEATETVGIGELAKTDPHMLSGGQKQRVAIAGILAMRPKCIVLDEATAMLDPVGRREVMRVAADLNKTYGITIVHITHHMDEVAECDRAVVVDDGLVVASGTPRELFSEPAKMRSWGLEVPGVTALLEALADAGVNVRRDLITIDEAQAELVKLLNTGTDPCAKAERFSAAAMEAREQAREQAHAPYVYREGANSVAAAGLSYTYGPGTPFEKKAIEDITFEAGDGEFLGIIGHTGCGKSTLVQHLNGLLKPGAGEVLIGGEKMAGANVKAMRRRVGLVFQYPEYQLFEATVAKDVAFGIRNDKLTEEEAAARVDEALRLVGLDPAEVREKSIYDLSGGQKRRVAIAGILVMQPGILVLDEPAAGLDPAGRDEILGICRRLNRENGNTVILVSHSMDDVARLCDRVLVMAHGGVELFGKPADVFEHEARLEEMGLTVPQLSKLFHRLDEALPDVHISRKIYSVEDGVNEILALLGRDLPADNGAHEAEVSGQ
ncbi:MAG: energy-coupling factor transporter ATPase [Clostridia bacterium]|nr:energy-coupling factor transporter ATPase [Clostridia bacterium]